MKTFTIDYYDIASNVWYWLIEHTTDWMTSLPPHMEIRTKRNLMECIGNINLCHSASYLSDFAYTSNGWYPISGKIAVWHENYLKRFDKEFNHMHIPANAITAIITHDILHEMLHFYMVWKKYTKGYCITDEDEFYKSMDNFAHFIEQELGSGMDENQNENVTLRLFELMVADFDGKVSVEQLFEEYKKGKSKTRILIPTYDSDYIMQLICNGKEDKAAAYYVLLYYREQNKIINTRVAKLDDKVDNNFRIIQQIAAQLEYMWKQNPMKYKFEMHFDDE